MARKKKNKATEKQKKVLGSIAAIQTMLERYPTLLTADFNSINLSVSFLMAILGMLNITQRDIAAWFAKLLSGRFNDGLLNTIEEAVKAVLFTNIKSLFTCPVDPLIPDELLWKYTNIDGAPSEGKGFDIDLDMADMMGILSFCPLTKDGESFYFDNSMDERNVIRSMDDLYKSRDFNAFLWYVMHRGSVNHAVKEGIDDKTRKSSWDNRCRYFKKHEYTEANYDEGIKSGALVPYFVCEYVERQENITEGSNRMKFYLDADRYRYKTKNNVSPNRTIFEFNYDYIYSQKLFDSKTLTAQIINAVLGLTSTVTGTVSLQKKIIEEQLHEVVKRILEDDDTDNDTTTVDSYFKFSNDEYDDLLNMANQKYSGKYKTGINDYTKVSTTKITECINKINTATNSEEEANYIADAFYTAAESISDDSERAALSEEWGVTFSIQTNIIERFIEEITTQLVLCMLSPKVSILYAINAYILKGNVDDLKSWETFLSTFGNLFTSIAKKIKDIILQELYAFVMDKLKPKLELYTNELLLETIRDYKDLLTNLWQLRRINGNNSSDGGNIIDNVDYADIIPQKNNPY